MTENQIPEFKGSSRFKTKSEISRIITDIFDRQSSLPVTNIYRKGQVIYYEENQPMGIHLICSGKVKLSRHLSGNVFSVIKMAEQGEFIGLDCLLYGNIYTATAVAHEDAEIKFIDSNFFFNLVREYPELMSIISANIHGHEVQVAGNHKNIYEMTKEFFRSGLGSVHRLAAELFWD